MRDQTFENNITRSINENKKLSLYIISPFHTPLHVPKASVKSSFHRDVLYSCKEPAFSLLFGVVVFLFYYLEVEKVVKQDGENGTGRRERVGHFSLQFTEKLLWNCFRFLLLYLTDLSNVFQPFKTSNTLDSIKHNKKAFKQAENTHNFSNMVNSLFHIALDIFW